MVMPLLVAALALAPAPRPLLRDFMGLNVHTVQFKTDLYKPTVRLVRDYHPVEWDITADPKPATFPMARNGVDWGTMYGSWVKAGYSIDACAMFETVPKDKWGDVSTNARAYGKAFAGYFGPSHQNLVSSIEIGNEPTDFGEEEYRSTFEAMAKGVREGDPKMQIVTCAVNLGKEDRYAKDIAALDGLESLYDVISVHQYAFKEMWPTFRRSYPEDPSITFLSVLQKLVNWRDKKAPGKPIWLTEFGWDSSTKTPSGEWSKWEGSTDLQQAQYLVRTFLCLSQMDVARAYIYFFNDADQPSLHGSSGITRDFQPKPSFYAVSHLRSALGGYRFQRIVRKAPGKVYIYEFVSPTDGKVAWAVWSPTGSGRTDRVPLPKPPGKLVRAEAMSTKAGMPEKASTHAGANSLEVEINESPMFLFFDRASKLGQ